MPKTFARIQKQFAQAVAEFGVKNPVVTHLNYLKFCWLAHNSERKGIQWEKLMRSVLIEMSRLNFGSKNLVFGNHQTHFSDHEYSFPQRHFSAEYSEAYLRFKKHFRRRIRFGYERQFLTNRFIYVITPDLKWVYYTKPQPISVALVGNKNLAEFPFHPVLIGQSNLKVAVSGEIAFRWHKRERQPRVIYASNVSGHFLPKEWLCRELESLLRYVLKVGREVSLVTLANDGICVTGPFGERLQEIKSVCVKKFTRKSQSVR